MHTKTTTEHKVGALKAGEISLPLTRMEVSGCITGLLHRTKVCQTFVNDHQVPLEAIYTHPLPPKASVHGFRLVIGTRVVEGKVQERQAARQAYAQAVAQGHRAALMEEERSDIFTTTVGNIAPGEQVSITFELSGPLEFLESTASLRFPLVVPEVYISGRPLGGGDVGDGTAADTDSVPDASRLTPPRLAPDAANPVNLKLSFRIDPAGLEIAKVDSLCHFAKTRLLDDGSYEISLLPGVERMDRDFVVRMQLKDGSLQTTLVHDPASGTFALTVVPPLGQSRQPAPRDLVIVLDRSGSMQGWSMTAARRAAARIVDSLTPMDRFALIAFDDRLELLEPCLLNADLRQKERAAEFLSQIDSRGGTAASPAIDKAMQMLKLETSADKTVLFITDGDVGNDAELVVRSAGGVRVSTVGIGRNSRAGVLERMASTSGGLCTIIPEESTLEEALRNLHQRLGRPHWMGLLIPGTDRKLQAPRYWDVWEGVPATFFGKAQSLAQEVTVVGWLASTGEYSQKVTVLHRDDLVIHRSWARARLLDLDDLWTIRKAEQHELVALSVEAQVLCRFTAFAAIDAAEVIPGSEQRKTVVQPVEPTLSRSPSAGPPVGGKRGGLRKLESSFNAGGKPMLGGRPPSSPIPGAPLKNRPMPSACRLPAPAVPPARDHDLFSAPARSCNDALFEAESDALELGSQLRQSSARSCESTRERAEAAATSKKKAEPAKQAIWTVLLEMLERLVAAEASARLPILEQMIDALGEHCRKIPSGSTAANSSKEVMSLLIDLQQTLYDHKDPEAQFEQLRSVLKSLG
jgi:Ca-activated chloride channel family protein